MLCSFRKLIHVMATAFVFLFLCTEHWIQTDVDVCSMCYNWTPGATLGKRGPEPAKVQICSYSCIVIASSVNANEGKLVTQQQPEESVALGHSAAYSTHRMHVFLIRTVQCSHILDLVPKSDKVKAPPQIIK